MKSNSIPKISTNNCGMLMSTKWVEHYVHLAKQALLTEVNLTPKPGLVDRINNGAHKDMTLSDFYASADAIAPWLAEFIYQGAKTHDLNALDVLPTLRHIGIKCEQAMYAATGNVNTHKGSIFSLGLICTAIGRLKANKQSLSAKMLCGEVAHMCKGIVERELTNNNNYITAGQRLFQSFGMTGARGEAESGYEIIINHILPEYQLTLAQGYSEQQALHQALLRLIVLTDDTNVVSRGGIDGLNWLKKQANTILLSERIKQDNYLECLVHLDLCCIERNLSPGGCADLLILTWFLYHI